MLRIHRGREVAKVSAGDNECGQAGTTIMLAKQKSSPDVVRDLRNQPAKMMEFAVVRLHA